MSSSLRMNAACGSGGIQEVALPVGLKRGELHELPLAARDLDLHDSGPIEQILSIGGRRAVDERDRFVGIKKEVPASAATPLLIAFEGCHIGAKTKAPNRAV